MSAREGRKTIDVKPYARKLQKAIELAETEQERKALVFAIELLLHESGNYRGYSQFDALGEWTRYDVGFGQANFYRRRYYGLER